MPFGIALVILLLVLIFSSLRVLNEYERGVMFSLGRFSGTGRVRYGGELWQARSSVPLSAGQAARIVKVEGLTLWVEPQ